MKKVRFAAMFLAIMLLGTSVLTACGGSGSQKPAEDAAKTEQEAPAQTEPAAEPEAAAPAVNAATPTADDAKAYVKAVMDVMCTGDYDHSVNIADIEEGHETELRDNAVAEALDSLAGDAGMNDEVKEQFKQALLTAFSKAKYTVGDAVPTEDGGYDVTVIVEPLKLFVDGKQKLNDKVTALAETEDLSSKSEDEVNNIVYALLVEVMNENMEDPQYADPVEVVVHYGLLDEANNYWGVSEEDGNKLGEVLFSTEGME